jgi:hypothetical protein
MVCVVCGKPAPTTPNMQRRYCPRCSTLAKWPCLPVPPTYRPRHSLLDEPEARPVLIWPAPAPVPVEVEVERCCIDCGAPLPEPTRPGRPRIRCEVCRAGRDVPDWERPAREPDWGGCEPPWLGELLRPDLPWEERERF